MADQASTSDGAKNDIWDKICDRTLLDDWVNQGAVITLTGVDLEWIGVDNNHNLAVALSIVWPGKTDLYGSDAASWPVFKRREDLKNHRKQNPEYWKSVRDHKKTVDDANSERLRVALTGKIDPNSHMVSCDGFSVSIPKKVGETIQTYDDILQLLPADGNTVPVFTYGQKLEQIEFVQEDYVVKVGRISFLRG
jgi:hypothetical protein